MVVNLVYKTTNMMEETIMADKAYEYMDWPRIEAIVYGEEASPRDVMQPRVTAVSYTHLDVYKRQQVW